MAERNGRRQRKPEEVIQEPAATGNKASQSEKDPLPLGPDELAQLRSLARGPETVRYAGPLVVSSRQIQLDILSSGIRDPQIRW